MKILSLALTLSLALASTLLAQTIVPPEKAQKAAELVNANLPKIEGLPVSVDPDLTKPQAIHADAVGIMVIPDKAIENAQPEENIAVPVGQLWLRSVALANVPKESVRAVTVQAEGKEHEMQLFILGGIKNSSGGYDLLVYGKGAEPVLRVPVVAAESEGSYTVPIELSGHKDSESEATLILKVRGKYTADLHLVKP